MLLVALSVRYMLDLLYSISTVRSTATTTYHMTVRLDGVIDIIYSSVGREDRKRYIRCGVTINRVSRSWYSDCENEHMCHGKDVCIKLVL